MYVPLPYCLYPEHVYTWKGYTMSIIGALVRVFICDFKLLIVFFVQMFVFSSALFDYGIRVFFYLSKLACLDCWLFRLRLSPL